MGRSQVERNRRARGRGRAAESRKRPVVARPQKIPEVVPDEEQPPEDLDARAEQLLSYGTTTSTAVSKLFVPSDNDGPSLLFTEGKSSEEMAELMKRLSQRLEAVPLKDRLRLPYHILEELYGKQYEVSSQTEVDQTKQPVLDEERNGDGDEEDDDDLDNWLDSVIQ